MRPPSCPNHDANIYAVIAAFQAAALANVLELGSQIFLTFKRYSGLYFWSILLATLGTGVQAVSYMLRFFVEEMPWGLYATMNVFGWWGMVTGSSLVLWSRMHLITRNHRLLRAVLAMIAIDALCLHTPTSVLFYLYFSPSSSARYAVSFSRIEKAQSVIFFLQEAIISGIYIKKCLPSLKSTTSTTSTTTSSATTSTTNPSTAEAALRARRTRKVHLTAIIINSTIILMSLILLAFQFADLWEVSVSLTPFFYSIKLRLQFLALNRLILLSHHKSSNRTLKRLANNATTTTASSHTITHPEATSSQTILSSTFSDDDDEVDKNNHHPAALLSRTSSNFAPISSSDNKGAAAAAAAAEADQSPWGIIIKETHVTQQRSHARQHAHAHAHAHGQLARMRSLARPFTKKVEERLSLATHGLADGSSSSGDAYKGHESDSVSLQALPTSPSTTMTTTTKGGGKR